MCVSQFKYVYTKKIYVLYYLHHHERVVQITNFLRWVVFAFLDVFRI